MKSFPVLLFTVVIGHLFLVLTLTGLAHTKTAVSPTATFSHPGVEPLGSGGGSIDLPTDYLSDEEREAIEAAISQNIAQLEADGRFSPNASQSVLLDWPLQAANGLADYGYHGMSGFVDQDSRYPGFLLDYNCGSRTYDTATGYNHQGTDFFTWPFGWNKMDNGEVIVVAAADGIISYKQDGNYDRSCSTSGGTWNAVYVTHSDGSQAWYGHLKSGSVTSKGMGDTVTAGEYLGVVGSSGNSTGPHLHLELYEFPFSLNDPYAYAGSCNQMNASSWWAAQRPYYDSAVNKVMTGDAPVNWGTCPEPEITHEQTYFTPGDTVYFTTFYRDQLSSQTSQYAIYQPDNSVFQSWSHNSNASHYAASWWYWYFSLPTDAPGGIWRFEVVFEGQTYETSFTVGNYITIEMPTGGEFWEPGETYTITWQDNLSGSVQIGLLHKGIQSTTLTTTTPSNGRYAWTIPISSTVGMCYQIQVVEKMDTAVYDISRPFVIGRQDQFFNIFLPVVLKN